jgi:hypothetical protein
MYQIKKIIFMKILKLTTIALLVLCLVATSCKKEEAIDATNNTTIANTDNAFSLTLNGTTFNTNPFRILEQVGKILINTDNYDSITVALVIKNDISVGTYNLDRDNHGGVDLHNDSSTFINSTSSYNTGGSGSITITEHNTTTKFMKGTFHFTATDINGANTQTVTNGSFQANY